MFVSYVDRVQWRILTIYLCRVTLNANKMHFPLGVIPRHAPVYTPRYFFCYFPWSLPEKWRKTREYVRDNGFLLFSDFVIFFFFNVKKIIDT